ncbi:protein of unknown function (DUF202) [Streptoalloteichus tenebrarius]|uniref:DUF202 domain-containing protein n=1 Tax=Streptoalloteichus tenebrarius (strain ATCC 17920 / DSM 40477 / JCM 4838 / CBS 697.72 / NBRC 16177 / NCIMB 11028 / NRRL B-12390 / A12253. 1 / ISP 5477) TaxID=1933 RepID=A0ABT1HTA3_STRSD|nr:DUF202 domain-containing protein [Streptoalloteichus tenebrarius]MCP2258745.1 protein of unknown function (DUF202) [Streptoalloteichus tenebrarius]BFF02899.1 hypothetical protein GCM10020241_45740 [Streptoalloteichus tenebrarius]
MSPWDPGLQPERTALAWVRTCLAFLVVVLVAVRFTANHNVVVAVVSAVVTLPLAPVLGVLVWGRYRRGRRRLHAERPLPDARLPAAATALAVLVGLVGVGYVLLG